MSKISQYAPIGSPASNDVLPIVDVDDPSMAQSGTTKTVTVSGLLGNAVQVAGDIGGTGASPQVTGTHLASPLPPLQGGTGLSESSSAALLAALLAAGGGAMGAGLSPKVTVLADGATISVNAALGNDFRVTLGGNRTMAAPSNATDGQSITFEVIQDGSGSRTLTWASGAAGYDFGAGGTPTLSTAANAIDLVAFRYSSSKGQWLCLGSGLGF